MPPEQATTSLTQWAISQGVLGVLFIIGIFFLYKGGQAVFNVVIVPAKDAFISHLAKVGDMMEKLVDTMNTVGDRLNKIDEKTNLIISDAKERHTVLDKRLADLEVKVATLPSKPIV